MKSSFEISVEISDPYKFEFDALPQIAQNTWVKNQWPLVYLIQNELERSAYVGESTNALARIKSHLVNPNKSKVFKTISIIGSDKFNKSATLDIESYLIQYLIGEGTFKVHNGNRGLVNHSYYQQDQYKQIFKEIWNKLIKKQIVTKSLVEIENSELFKYSPYKSLNDDQYNSVIEILDALTSENSQHIFVNGSAGTGKTILATYLLKLLKSGAEDLNLDDISTEEEIKEVNLIRAFQKKYPKAKIGMVVAMSSLRESLQNVFKLIPGLKSSMVVGPSETFTASNEPYDLLIVDEAHRLRQYRNLGWMGAFKKNNEKLGLDNSGTELDWIIANSRNQIFFYDPAQSVKPSDIDERRFTEVLNKPMTRKLTLVSQMRVKGGNNYISFVDDLLQVKRSTTQRYSDKDYELLIFDSLQDLYNELGKKEQELGLCRLVAGYSWPWPSEDDANAIDIEIDGLQFQWNRTPIDWVNSPTAFKEVGCIHTTQGYDLNYTGVIFGREIDYNPATNKIEVNPKLYFDMHGKRGTTTEDLHGYIINIYKTIMYRGIRGTYVYAFNKNLRNYFKKHIRAFKKDFPFRILTNKDIKPYVNSIPFFDISVAAGSFSELQIQSDTQWIELPFNIAVREGYFVCQVVGESMNKKIPNGSYCLFKTDEGGSRHGKIVLVQSMNIQDSDFGAGYTVKEYHSTKNHIDEQWSHKSITLTPLSNDDRFKEIKIENDQLNNFKVIGVFEKVL